MQDEAEVASKRTENHAVAAVVGKERFVMLYPRSLDRACRRLGDSDGVAVAAEARPDHKEFPGSCAVEVASVGDVALRRFG